MNKQIPLSNSALNEARKLMKNTDYNTSIQQFNCILQILEPYITTFNQQNLEEIMNIFQSILEDLNYLQLQPTITIWRINFTDLLPTLTFNQQFIKSLCEYYVSITECSQIFRTPLFNQIFKQLNQLLCIFSWDRYVSDEIRHSKSLRSIIRMIRINATEELLNLAIIVSKNPKNSEYMIIKKTQDQLLMLLKNNINKNLVQLIIANMCYSNDQRLLFWCQGILNFIRLTLDSSTLTLIWKLIYDCSEVIEELLNYGEFFNHLYKQINSYTEESALMIGIIRKICENNTIYKSQHVENIVNSFTNLLNSTQSNNIPQPIRSFIFKEIFSFFGLVGNQFINPQIMPKIIVIISQNINDIKLLTVSIGMLTNLTTQQSIQKFIENDKLFYQIILQILDEQNEKSQLIEYTLKLMINTVTNQSIAIKYAQPQFIMKLLFIWHLYPQVLINNTLIIRILKGLYIVTNIIASLLSQCIIEIETRNPSFNFLDLCSIIIKLDLEANKNDNAVEVFMFISVIPNLKYNSKNFQDAIKTYVELMKKKGELKKAIQTISNLPIEDMGIQF